VSEPWQTILTLAAGLATGVLSGMFGVGGAVVSTPAIRVLGATPLEAIGSTIPSIVPSAVSGSLRYRREASSSAASRAGRWPPVWPPPSAARSSRARYRAKAIS